MQKLAKDPEFGTHYRTCKHTGETVPVIPVQCLLLVYKPGLGRPVDKLVTKVEFSAADVTAVFKMQYGGPDYLRGFHFARWLVKHGYAEYVPFELQRSLEL